MIFKYVLNILPTLQTGQDLTVMSRKMPASVHHVKT